MAGHRAPREAWIGDAELVVASEVKQAGAQDLVLEAARALVERRAEAGWEAEDPEHERDFRP